MIGKKQSKPAIIKSLELKLHLRGRDFLIEKALELLELEWYVPLRYENDLLIGTVGSSGRIEVEIRFRGFFLA